MTPGELVAVVSGYRAELAEWDTAIADAVRRHPDAPLRVLNGALDVRAFYVQLDRDWAELIEMLEGMGGGV